MPGHKFSSAAPQTFTVERLSAEGRGVARIEGKAVFIEGALPGEQVSARYVRRQRRYDEAQLIEVLSPSPARVTPPCPHFSHCGGCALQHLAPDAQIQAKAQIMHEQLAHIGGLAPAQHLPPITTAHTLGYRRKARLSVKYVAAKGGVLVGFRERRGHYLADLQHCPILHPRVGERLNVLKDRLTTLKKRDRIPQIELAVGDDDRPALIFRTLDVLGEADRETLIALGKDCAMDIWLQPKGPDSAAPLWPTEDAGLYYTHPEFAVTVRFTPLDFIQVNAAVNRLMVAQAIALLALEPHHKVLDLYCGLGNFTLPLARHSAEVVGVEGEASMVERARANAQANGIHTVRYYTADLSQVQADAPWSGERFDRVLLDPPRAGAAAILANIAATQAERIVYVSCNPATLARDAAQLVTQHGYHLEAAGAIDMFPHTAHAESIAVFSR